MKHTHFLLGIDSDGTAFDSMNRKHIDAFIPAALEIWPMPQETADHFSEIEQDINLFSEHRGINRFPGLLMTMERLNSIYPDTFPKIQDLHEYVQHVTRYSQKSLEVWVQAHPSEFLDQVIDWSQRSDILFENACKNMKPFDGVLEALQIAYPYACIAVISSAAKASLKRDWTNSGLARYVDVMLSQEDGNKQEQLLKAAFYCSQPVAALMIGDTSGDRSAALAAESNFFFIQPGHECESWEKLTQRVLPAWLNHVDVAP